MSGAEATGPVLRVVSADATPEEVAALVAVFSAMGGGSAPKPRPRPEWQAPHRRLRAVHPHGPQGWRASALPR
ncbi:acyl-CoA carboxylase subunit epsilon [Nocardioides ferulae]|uniref:acyl-CoA carboxylase subunit epsilon n=1 Tax=Nocardioides ferulae TaxID=2340821 RepID=UPI000EB0879E|nr:acyl-CoA carboxylase subunit epsilon [Nocardioides ferulae]